MDPSSLIFLVIIAIWAAYLLGHWVRRRDQMATARSIDRFSEAMRVLERRTPTRPVAAARPTARSYVVAPVRVPPAVPRTKAPGGSSTPAPTSGRAGSRPSSRQPGRITREAARRRTRLLLALLVASVVAWVLVATSPLAWWAATVETALLAAVLVQLRRTARRQATSAARARTHDSARTRSRRSAGSAAPRSRRTATRRGLASRVPAPARRRHHQDARSVLQQLGETRRAQDAAALATATVAPNMVAGTVLSSDVDPALAHGEQVQHGAADSHDALAADGGWQPVPVPPPTYTLKPKARPVVRRPAPDLTESWVDEDDAVERDAVERDAEERDAAGAGQAPGTAGHARAPRSDVRPSAASAEPTAPAFDLDEILERRIAAGG